MLYLDARVHLQEVKLLPGEQELHRAGALITDRPRQPRRRLLHPIPDRGSNRGARRFLDQLLVPALHRAITLTKSQHLSRGQTDELYLHMLGVFEKALQVDGGVAEIERALAPRGLQSLGYLALLVDHPQPPTAAARHGLDCYRKPVLQGEAVHLLPALHRLRSGHKRHARLLREATRDSLVAHLADRGRAGADPRDAHFPARLGQVRVLREESVTGVERVHAGPVRHVHQLADVQVTLGRRPATERVGFIRPVEEGSITVRV